VAVLYGVVANLLWSSALLVPYILPEVSILNLTVGRYIVYGLICCAVIAIYWRSYESLLFHYARQAIILSITGKLFYFLCLLNAVKFSGASSTGFVLGLLPIFMISYTRFVRKENTNQPILIPFLFIFVGVIILGFARLDRLSELPGSLSDYLYGLASSILALLSWTYYSVKNREFLAKYSNISSIQWGNLLGFYSFILSLLIFFLPIQSERSPFNQFLIECSIFQVFILLYLGVVVTHLGTILWNASSRRQSSGGMGLYLLILPCSGYLFDVLLGKSVISVMGVGALIFVVLGTYFLSNKRAMLRRWSNKSV